MAFKYFEKDTKDAIPLKRGPLKLEETVKWSFVVLMDFCYPASSSAIVGYECAHITYYRSQMCL